MLVMMVGTGFYVVGLTMYGFVASYILVLVATLIIVVGEMIVVPVGQALAARFASEDMRGRYMAFYTLAWTIPSTVGPWAAGLIMDNYNPDWVWYVAGIVSVIAAAGFGVLHLVTRVRFASVGDEKQPVPAS
jgi:MFS family permease